MYRPHVPFLYLSEIPTGRNRLFMAKLAISSVTRQQVCINNE
jgi:hypothetical protein